MLALKPARYSKAARGFTLIELLVTIAIAAILMMVGVPSFIAFQRNSELTAAANSLLAAINAARAEAMKRNLNAFVIPTDKVNWKNGWTVFVDTDRNNDLGTADIIVMTKEALPSYFSTPVGTGNAQAGTPYIMFNGSGYASSKDSASGNLTLQLARSDVSSVDQTRLLLVAVTGRARICKPASAQDATCKSTLAN